MKVKTFKDAMLAYLDEVEKVKVNNENVIIDMVLIPMPNNKAMIELWNVNLIVLSRRCIIEVDEPLKWSK